MAVDDLSAPLGQKPSKRRRGIKIPVPQIIAGALALFLGVFVLWSIVADDPFGGEPMAVTPVNLHLAAKPADVPAAPQAAAPDATLNNATPLPPRSRRRPRTRRPTPRRSPSSMARPVRVRKSRSRHRRIRRRRRTLRLRRRRRAARAAGFRPTRNSPKSPRTARSRKSPPTAPGRPMLLPGRCSRSPASPMRRGFR